MGKWNDEHLIPKSYGGKLAPGKIVCPICNKALGSLDEQLPHELDIIRNFLGIRKPKVKKLRAIDDADQTFYELDPNSTLKLAEVKITLQIGEHFREFHGEDPEELASAVLQTLCQWKSRGIDIGVVRSKVSGDPEKAATLLSAMEPFMSSKKITTRRGKKSPPSALLTPSTTIGGHEQFRAVAKMAYEFLGYKLGNDFALDNQFNSIRKYITNGPEKEFYFPATFDFQNLFFTAPDELQNLTGFENHFINRVRLFLDGDRKEVVASVELFRDLRFSVVLSQSYHGESASYGLTNWPLSSKNRDVPLTYSSFRAASAHEILDINPKNELPNARGTLDNLVKLAGQYREIRKFREMLREALKRIGERFKPEKLAIAADFMRDVACNYLRTQGIDRLKHHHNDDFQKSLFSQFRYSLQFGHLEDEMLRKLSEYLSYEIINYFG